MHTEKCAYIGMYGGTSMKKYAYSWMKNVILAVMLSADAVKAATLFRKTQSFSRLKSVILLPCFQRELITTPWHPITTEFPVCPLLWSRTANQELLSEEKPMSRLHPAISELFHPETGIITKKI